MFPNYYLFNYCHWSNFIGWGVYFLNLQMPHFLASKFLFFSLGCIFYGLYVFRNDFLRNYLQLEHSLAGDLIAIMFLTGFISMALWGSIADYTGRHKFVLGMLSITSGLSFFIFLISKRLNNLAITTFGLVLYSLFVNGLQPLTDFAVLKILGERNDLYSEQKLWETCACGATSFFLSDLIARIGFVALFWWIPIAATIFFLAVYFIAPSDKEKAIIKEREQAKFKKEIESSHQFPLSASLKLERQSEKEEAREGKNGNPLSDSKNIIKFQIKSENDQKGNCESSHQNKKEQESERKNIDCDKLEQIHKQKQDQNVTSSKETNEKVKVKKIPLYHLFKIPSFIFLIINIFLVGLARMTLSIFFSSFLQDHVKLSVRHVGIASNIGLILEVVTFYFGPQALAYFGPDGLFFIAQLAMTIRAWFYVWLPIHNPYTVYMIFGIELLKGLAFGCATCAGVKIASQSAPDGLKASAQAIYTGMYSQLPAVIGSSMGGRIYGRKEGPKELFFGIAIVCTIALGLFILKLIIFPSNNKKEEIERMKNIV